MKVGDITQELKISTRWNETPNDMCTKAIDGMTANRET